MQKSPISPIPALIMFFCGIPARPSRLSKKFAPDWASAFLNFFHFVRIPCTQINLQAREEELLNAYRQLSVQDKALIEAYLDGLCKTLKRQKDSIHEETNEKQKKTRGRPKQKKQI